MLHLKVAAILAPLLLLQALSSMAASLHVPRGGNSGVITALLRSPKGSRSVPRGLHIRQTTCPGGSYECSDGKGCCDIGFDCVVVSGKSGCCPTGSTCGGPPVCQNPGDDLCPGGEFCCPPGEQCLPNFTCGGPGGFSTTSKLTIPTTTSPLFDTSTQSAFFSTTSTPLVPSPSTLIPSPSALPLTPSAVQTTSSSSPNTFSPSTTTSRPGIFSSSSKLTANSLPVFAVIVVGSLFFIN